MFWYFTWFVKNTVNKGLVLGKMTNRNVTITLQM